MVLLTKLLFSCCRKNFVDFSPCSTHSARALNFALSILGSQSFFNSSFASDNFNCTWLFVLFELHSISRFSIFLISCFSIEHVFLFSIDANLINTPLKWASIDSQNRESLIISWISFIWTWINVIRIVGCCCVGGSN